MLFYLIYSPALETACDHWEDHSLDYVDLCQQNNVSVFQHTAQVSHCFPSKKQSSSDVMAAVSICSDFGAKEEEICHFFHLSSFYLPCSNGARCHDLSFFLIFSPRPTLSLSSFALIKRLFSSSSLSAIGVVST